nr:cytochrome P450 [Chroococcidiopsis thermalis]
MKERREQSNPAESDVLSRLMSVRDEAGQQLTDAELLYFSMITLFNGYETTSSTLTWILYWIHHQPEIHDKLRDEINALGANPDPIEIYRLPYLTAICKETQRLCPVVVNGSGRILKSPLQFMGYQLEPGTQLIPSIYLTHMREDLYPQPQRFIPERFLEKKYSQYEYFPFGGGHAICSGLALAQTQMKLVLAVLMSRLQLALTNNRPIKTENVGAFLVTPQRDLQMVVTEFKRLQIQI